MMVDISSGDLTIQTHTHLHLELYCQICVKQNGKQVSQSKIQNLRRCRPYIQNPPDRAHTQFTHLLPKLNNVPKLHTYVLKKDKYEYKAWKGCWLYFRHGSSQCLTIIEHQKKNIICTPIYNLPRTKQQYTVQY
jgi:hypothetical protein